MSVITEHKDMKVGDIITTYNSGFHRLLKIEKNGDNVLFFYQRVATNEGELKNIKTELYCQAGFCKPAIYGIEKFITYLEESKKKIEDFKKLVIQGKV